MILAFREVVESVEANGDLCQACFRIDVKKAELWNPPVLSALLVGAWILLCFVQPRDSIIMFFIAVECDLNRSNRFDMLGLVDLRVATKFQLEERFEVLYAWSYLVVTLGCRQG